MVTVSTFSCIVLNHQLHAGVFLAAVAVMQPGQVIGTAREHVSWIFSRRSNAGLVLRDR